MAKLRIGSGSHSHLCDSVPLIPGRWRHRLFLLALGILSLFFVAAGEFGRSSALGANRAGIVAALKGKMVAALEDPLSLLARRSPGGRGPGALHLTKSGALPHERVLSQVRQRAPAPVLVPVADTPIFAENAPDIVPPPIAAPPIILPEAAPVAPADTSLMPMFVMPLGFPGIPGGGTDIPGGPGTPPGGPSTGTPPLTITVSEPATWLSMILGLVALFMMLRMKFNGAI